MTQPIDFWAYRKQQLRALRPKEPKTLGFLAAAAQHKNLLNAPAEISMQRVPVGYNENKMRRLSAEEYNKTLSFPAGKLARSKQLFVGERGGRYYKRTRADGTTYRDYTY